MQRSEVYQHIDTAWTTLSQKRGYSVYRDDPVCIHVCQLIEKETSPVFHIIKMPIPEHDDFQALLIGDVDNRLHIVDPVYLAWRTPRLPENPSLNQATLFLPVTSKEEVEKHIPDICHIHRAYVVALTGMVSHLIDA